MGTKAIVKKPIDGLKIALSSPTVKEQFQNALEKHADKFTASLIDLVASDKGLQKCNPNLIVLEALKAATLNLPINRQLGFAYIVPYKDTPQFQIGYKGMIQLAMRSGVYRYLNAGPVFEGEYQGHSKLTGELDISGEKTSDKIVGFFSYMETTNGFRKALYMSLEEITAHAKRFSKSYSSKSSPWQTDFNAMAEKTMLRRLLSRYGQMTVDMAEAMAADVDEPDFEAEYQSNANSEMLNVEPETEEKKQQPQPLPEPGF